MGWRFTPLTGVEGGVKIDPDIPSQDFGFNNQDFTDSYELIIRPEFTQPNETALIEVVGTGGVRIESYVISNIDKNIYYISRDRFGNLETELFGSFSANTDITIQRKREYHWWPPTCTGDRCDYGIDIPGGLIFAKWRIGKSAIAQDPSLPGTGPMHPSHINVKSSSKFFVTKFAVRDFFPLLEHALLGIKPSVPFYKQNSGDFLTLEIEKPFFNQISNISVEVSGVPATNIQVISPTEIKFLPPQNLSKGEKEISFKAYCSSEDIDYEITVQEKLMYHVSNSPLVIDDMNISNSLLTEGTNYLIKLTASGGGHKNKHFELISGALPTGMHMTPSGNIVGVPSLTGIFSCFVRAYDNTGEEQIKLLFIEVEENTGAKNEDNGVLGNSETMEISFFPNPSSDFLNVQLKNMEGSLSRSVTIYSLSGEIMYVLPNAEIINKIDVSSFTNGTYLVKVVTDGEIYIKKFAIIK